MAMTGPEHAKNRLTAPPHPAERRILLALAAAAVALRIGARLAFGEQYFWSNSYYAYYAMAANIAGGKGFCLPSGCAWLPPLYPLLLVPSVLAGKSFLFVVVPQALLGAGTALLAYLIGSGIFNRRTGLIACAATAFYPYYLMHDTALQDTGMVTFGAALSVWLLLRACRCNRNIDWLIAGIALGSIALIRSSVVFAIPAGVIWCVVWGVSGATARRLRKGAVVALGATLALGPWLIYTAHATGVPVITSQNGLALWMGNNSETFSHYPAGSIDRSRDEAYSHLSESDRAELSSRAHDEIATSNWYADRALGYMKANPLLVARGAVRKIEAGFSWRLNPYREMLAQAAYFIGYAPIAILGAVGMVLARDRPGTALVAMLFLCFIIVTAIFWAHTSHRTYLDIYLIVFSASVVDLIWMRLALSRVSSAARDVISAGPGNSTVVRPISQSAVNPAHS
jgi:4-amino-4-deoxy-L-arabinose transferase-like glycosyltransferase